MKSFTFLTMSILNILMNKKACEIQVKDSEWDGVRRKYWHGRDVYYLPIVTWNNGYLVKEHFQNAQATTVLDQNEKRGINAVVGDEQDNKKLRSNC